MRTIAWLLVIVGIVLGNPFASVAETVYRHVTAVLVSGHAFTQAVSVFSVAVQMIVR